MNKIKVAVVGLGIVGSVCAYYLTKSDNIDLTLFDYDLGQATKASAGIICPYFSKRRNKKWYNLANEGVAFYTKLINDFKKDNINTDFYLKNGVFLLRENEEKLNELYEIALKRKINNPNIDEISIKEYEEVKKIIPSFSKNKKVIYSNSAFKIDGKKYVDTILNYLSKKTNIINKKVSLQINGEKYIIDNKEFDIVVLATGAFLSDILNPLGYKVDLNYQKGQLADYLFPYDTSKYPLIMPEGEMDIIPSKNQIITIGASHENHKNDLQIDKNITHKFYNEALAYINDFKNTKLINERVGIRGYTNDHSVFFSKINSLKNVYAIGGLGSSGLTTGAIIGYTISNDILNKENKINMLDYDANSYISLF